MDSEHQKQQQQIQQQHQRHQQHQQQQQHHLQQVSLQQPHQQTQAQQPQTQMFPSILPPPVSSSGLTPSPNESYEQNQNLHTQQIIEQVLSLENEFSVSGGMLGNVAHTNSSTVNSSHQLGDLNLGNDVYLSSSNQFSSSSEDLFNMLLDFDSDQVLSFQNLDQDEKTRIESIRNQLMSCEVQSEPEQSSSSPILLQQHQHIQHQQVGLRAGYTDMTSPVSTSSQPYASTIRDSASTPTWQQSSYVTQQNSSNVIASSNIRQQQQQHQIPQHSIQTSCATSSSSSSSTSLQVRHQTQAKTSASQSISPQASAEPSPVVRKNPLLNAQLVNSRGINASNRFSVPIGGGNTADVLNQNPILNAKLSQGQGFLTDNNDINQTSNLNVSPQPGYIQRPQTLSNQNNYNIKQQQYYHQNQMGIYGLSSDQPSNNIFRTSTTSPCLTSDASYNTGMTSPIGLSEPVKPEIRRKTGHQATTTSLLKQLLSEEK